MSYDKIKNISIQKNKVTICYAPSNIRPITYETIELKELSKKLAEPNGKEEIIKGFLWDFDNGSFHSTNDKANRKFLYAINYIGYNSKAEELHAKYWDYESKCTAEEKQAIKEELKTILYERYLTAEKLEKENKHNKYILTTGNYYIHKVGQSGNSYRKCFTEGNAKEFNYLYAIVTKQRLHWAVEPIEIKQVI